ncbi:MAG: nucleoside phosphorylase [Pseudomonadota bacterium]
MNFPTWSDLNSESIVPPLGTKKAPDIGPVALMVSCKPDVNLIKSQLINPREFPFFNNILMTCDDGDKGICVAGPFMGAPYGAMILESLIARGAKKIIVLGWCGAVSSNLNVGDIIAVDKAIVDEGTSCNYVDFGSHLPCSEPDQKLTDQLMDSVMDFWTKKYEAKNLFNHKDQLDSADPAGQGQHSDVPFPKRLTKQTIWTTDAIYRETPKKVDHFKTLGARAVEMECSALFSVAKFRKVDITALLVVSDSVAAIDWNPGFRKKVFQQAREIACEAVLNFTKKMSKNG